MAEFEYFEGLFTNSHVNGVLLMDTAGDIISINPAFTVIFGYTIDEVKGKNFSIFFTEQDRLLQKPQKELAMVANTGQGDDKNYIVHQNGTVTWVSGESVLISSTTGEKRILKLIQDIRQQKESELSLSRANHMQQNILETITDAVIVLDESMYVLSANKAFYRLLRNELSPFADFAAFIRPYDATGTLVEKIRSVIDTGSPFTKQEIEIFNPKGEQVFEVSCHAMRPDDDKRTFLLVAHDITVQKRVQTEREDIMGFVAHELRNPLANIMLTNEMMTILLKNHPLADFEALLVKSKNNIIRLNKMITELYDAEKVNAGKFIPDKSSFDFDDMIKEAIDTIQVLHPAYNIACVGRAGITVTGDRYRLIQVVTNYLNNGIKYSNGQTDVTLNVMVKGNVVIASVEDKGLGIADDQLPYIFDRFFRAEKTRNLEGIGLGLYLCRRIMDAHNGKVWAESEEGKGSKFYLSLPIL